MSSDYESGRAPAKVDKPIVSIVIEEPTGCVSSTLSPCPLSPAATPATRSRASSPRTTRSRRSRTLPARCTLRSSSRRETWWASSPPSSRLVSGALLLTSEDLRCFIPRSLQGYLTHKKAPPPRTPQ